MSFFSLNQRYGIIISCAIMFNDLNCFSNEQCGSCASCFCFFFPFFFFHFTVLIFAAFLVFFTVLIYDPPIKFYFETKYFGLLFIKMQNCTNIVSQKNIEQTFGFQYLYLVSKVSRFACINQHKTDKNTTISNSFNFLHSHKFT